MTPPNFRILFTPSGIGFAHLGRLLLIAEQLKEHGHQIKFAVSRRHEELLAQLGYEWSSINEVHLPDRQRFTDNIFDLYTERVIQKCVQDELDVMGEFKPDVIVMDLRPTVSISSRIAGIPCISILNAYLTDHFDVTGLLMNSEAHSLKFKITDLFVRKILAAQKTAIGRRFRQVAKQYGIRDKSSLYEFLAGDLNLIADLKEFAPLVDAPGNFQHIGPVIWEGRESDGAEFLPVKYPNRKSLYVTIGHTGNPKLLELVVTTFGSLEEFHLVITTGPDIDPTFCRGHSNISVHQFVPGSTVMRTSDLVIHCGGNGTTYQCLANGLPAITVPFNNDQRINARLIRRNNVGIPFSIDRLDGERLLHAAEYILGNQTYYEQARRFQRKLQSIDGPKNAAETISQLLYRQIDRVTRTAHTRSLAAR